jgi:hypothetical protein
MTRTAFLRVAVIGGVLALALGVTAAGVAWLTPKSSPHARHSTPPSPGSASADGRSVTRQPGSQPSLAAHPATKSPAAAASALAAHHVRICGNSSILDGGPSARPTGAVSVPAGDNSRVNWKRAHTTYWFAPGIHTLGRGRYSQIQPGTGSTFIGAPGAVLDGRQVNYYAFGGNAPHVTISYLTIENFGTAGGNFNQGSVNTNSAADWTIDHTTVRDNAGAGVMLGSRDTLRYDCLLENQQYGFNAYSVPGPVDLTLADNEIAENDT